MPSLKLKIKADSSNSLRPKIIINYPLLKIEGHPSEANFKADLSLKADNSIRHGEANHHHSFWKQ